MVNARVRATIAKKKYQCRKLLSIKAAISNFNEAAAAAAAGLPIYGFLCLFISENFLFFLFNDRCLKFPRRIKEKITTITILIITTV